MNARQLSWQLLAVSLLIPLGGCDENTSARDASSADDAATAQMDGARSDGAVADSSPPLADATRPPLDATRPPFDATVPSDIADIPMNEWRTISRNTISDVDPCPVSRCAWSAVEGQSGVVNDWTGGALATQGTPEAPLGGLLVFGGGHNGYYGNEVYFFNLATGYWERRNEPTDGRTPGDANTFELGSDCLYWDDNPVAFHTYDTVWYDPRSHRFWLSNRRDVTSFPPGRAGGCGSRTATAFDLNTNTWDTSPSDTSSESIKFGATAFDERRGVAWVINTSTAGNLLSYDPVADRWQTHANNGPLTLDVTGAIDPDHDLFVLADHRAGRVVAHDLSAPDERWFVLNTTGATEIQGRSKVGFEWAPELGAFVAWSQGPSVYLLTPPATDVRTGEWRWSRVDTGGADPGTPVNGPYSKFQWVPGLGVAVVAHSVTGPVYALRLAPP